MEKSPQKTLDQVISLDGLRAHMHGLLGREATEAEIQSTIELAQKTPWTEKQAADVLHLCGRSVTLGLRRGDTCISLGRNHGRTYAMRVAEHAPQHFNSPTVHMLSTDQPTFRELVKDYSIRFDEIDSMGEAIRKAYPEMNYSALEPVLHNGKYVWAETSKYENRVSLGYFKVPVPDRLPPWVVDHAFHFESRTPWAITKWNREYLSREDASSILELRRSSTSALKRLHTASQTCADILEAHGCSILLRSIPFLSQNSFPEYPPNLLWKDSFTTQPRHLWAMFPDHSRHFFPTISGSSLE